MARSQQLPEKTSLVVGLCPDTSVYARLVDAVSNSWLTCSTRRAVGSKVTVRTLESGQIAAGSGDQLVTLGGIEHKDQSHDRDAMSDVSSEPLLRNCFSYLEKVPGGGAPWQGSWRKNALEDVMRSLASGGVLLVVEAHSLDEQRDWARMLLRGGCAFVHTYEAAGAGLAAATSAGSDTAAQIPQTLLPE